MYKPASLRSTIAMATKSSAEVKMKIFIILFSRFPVEFFVAETPSGCPGN